MYKKLLCAITLLTVTAILCMDPLSKRVKTEPKEDHVFIQTVDQEFQVPLKLVKLSHTLNNLLIDAGTDHPIPLPNVNTFTWQIIEYLLQQLQELSAEDADEFKYKQKIVESLKSLPVSKLIDVISALNYLDIPPLLSFAMHIIENMDMKDVPFELLPKDLRAELNRYHALRILGPAPIKLIERFKGHDQGWVTALAITHDGATVVSGGLDATIRVWDVDSGMQLREMHNPGGSINALCLTGDDKYIISVSDDFLIRLWNLETGEELRTYSGHTDWVFYIALNPNGTSFTTLSSDATIRMWDIESPDALKVYTFKLAINTMTQTSNGALFIVSDNVDNRIITFNATTGKKVRSFQVPTKSISSVALSPNGLYILVGTHTGDIFVYEAETGTLQKTLLGHTAEVNMISVLHDNKKVVSISDDGTLRVWDMHLGIQLAQSINNESKLQSMCLVPNDNNVITGSLNGQIRMWNIGTLDELFKLFSTHTKEPQTRAIWNYLQTDHKAGWRGIQALLDNEELPAVQGTVTFPPYVRVYDLEQLERDLRELNEKNRKKYERDNKRHKSSTEEQEK